MVAIAGISALPLESHLRSLAAELSWCWGWWVTQSLGGEGPGELAGGGGAAGSPCCRSPAPVRAYSSLQCRELLLPQFVNCFWGLWWSGLNSVCHQAPGGHKKPGTVPGTWFVG